MSSEEPEHRQGNAATTQPSISKDDTGLAAPPDHTDRHRHVKVLAERGTMSANEPQEDVSQKNHTPTQIPGDASASTYKVNSNLRKEELVRGAHPGDRYIRYGRNIGPFKRKAGGVLAASIEAEVPRSKLGRSFNRFKRTLIGHPISTEQSIHERLTNVKGLAVLSSDPLSSVAYATEEILRVLVLVGLVAIQQYALAIGFAIALLLTIVATSYRQTIAAYPRGGGSYIVAKDNLGTLAGLTAAASILIDYTMTVAVSVSAGIDAVNSLFPDLPQLRDLKVEICLVVIFLLTIANLRGVRESGNIFMLPTYLFIAGIIGMIGFGLIREFFGVAGGLHYLPPEDPGLMLAELKGGTEALGIVLLLRAFSQGCTALTGVEAISDGVPAFKPPEWKNARTTLAWMAVTAITMFIGITFLATQMQVIPSEKETVLSQIARSVFAFGPGWDWLSGPAWFYINIATALILVLAANTAFSDFPRLGYFLARDKFMPHQYSFRGDRLAFSWGIVTLAAIACILIIAFGGNVTALIPLYTVGVFLSFTLSQTGMVVRWWRTKTPGWQRNLLINGLGALVTFIVLVISTWTKFFYGAWIVIALIPVLIAMFLAINKHYERFKTDVEAVTPLNPKDFKHTIIVPVANLNAVAMSALAYARSLSQNVTAVHIAEGEDMEGVERFNEEWQRLMQDSDVPLVIIESPYRSLIGPLLSYIDALDQQSPDDTITVVLPELLPARPWEYLLHNQTALSLKARLLFRPNTVVANVPYVLGRGRTSETTASRSAWAGIPIAPAFIAAMILLLAYYVFLGER